MTRHILALILPLVCLALAACSTGEQPAPRETTGLLSGWLSGDATAAAPMAKAEARAYTFDNVLGTLAIFAGLVMCASGRFPNWAGFSLATAGLGVKFTASAVSLLGGLVATIALIAGAGAALWFLFKSRGTTKLFASVRDFFDGRDEPTPQPTQTELSL